MRRLFAILLLAVFGLPFLSPLLALGQGVEAGLPACCRRNGAHHCGMTMGERSAQGTHDPRVQAPAEKCPYCPASLASVHPDPRMTPPAAEAIFAGVIRHPASHAQTESKWRVARDRSRQKRGPPTPSLG